MKKIRVFLLANLFLSFGFAGDLVISSLDGMSTLKNFASKDARVAQVMQKWGSAVDFYLSTSIRGLPKALADDLRAVGVQVDGARYQYQIFQQNPPVFQSSQQNSGNGTQVNTDGNGTQVANGQNQVNTGGNNTQVSDGQNQVSINGNGTQVTNGQNQVNTGGNNTQVSDGQNQVSINGNGTQVSAHNPEVSQCLSDASIIKSALSSYSQKTGQKIVIRSDSEIAALKQQGYLTEVKTSGMRSDTVENVWKDGVCSYNNSCVQGGELNCSLVPFQSQTTITVTSSSSSGSGTGGTQSSGNTTQNNGTTNQNNGGGTTTTNSSSSTGNTGTVYVSNGGNVIVIGGNSSNSDGTGGNIRVSSGGGGNNTNGGRVNTNGDRGNQSTGTTEGTGSGDTGSGDTGSGDTGSGDTGSGDTGSGDTGSGDTGTQPQDPDIYGVPKNSQHLFGSFGSLIGAVIVRNCNSVTDGTCDDKDGVANNGYEQYALGSDMSESDFYATYNNSSSGSYRKWLVKLYDSLKNPLVQSFLTANVLAHNPRMPVTRIILSDDTAMQPKPVWPHFKAGKASADSSLETIYPQKDSLDQYYGYNLVMGEQEIQNYYQMYIDAGYSETVAGEKTQIWLETTMIHEMVHGQQSWTILNKDTLSWKTYSTAYGGDKAHYVNEITSANSAWFEALPEYVQGYYNPSEWTSMMDEATMCGFMVEDSDSSVEAPKYNGGNDPKTIACDKLMGWNDLSKDQIFSSELIFANLLLEYRLRSTGNAVDLAVKDILTDPTYTSHDIVTILGAKITDPAEKEKYAVMVDLMTGFKLSIAELQTYTGVSAMFTAQYTAVQDSGSTLRDAIHTRATSRVSGVDYGDYASGDYYNYIEVLDYLGTQDSRFAIKDSRGNGRISSLPSTNVLRKIHEKSLGGSYAPVPETPDLAAPAVRHLDSGLIRKGI